MRGFCTGAWGAQQPKNGGLRPAQKQSKDYDAGGDYVRTWLPEVRALPPRPQGERRGLRR